MLLAEELALAAIKPDSGRHALDGTDLEPVGKAVRRLIPEAATAAAASVASGGTAAATSG
jgi:hypothetical protein